MEDSKIIDFYLNRDESAISHTADKYGSMLRSVSKRITGDAEEAEECVNDTYLEAWNRIPPSKPRDYFPAFLSRIVRNISINRCVQRERLKRKAFITELSEEMEQCIPSSDNVESRIDEMEFGRLISGFLRKQSEEKRKVFIRRYYYLDTVTQIAEEFGCSENRMTQRLLKIRKKLKTFVEKGGYEL